MSEILTTEKVRNCVDEKEYLGHMLILEKKHIPALQELQETVYGVLDRPDLFVKLSEKEWEAVLGKEGLVVGLEAEGRIRGFSGLLYPGRREDNLGLDIGMKEEELLLVAHLETVAVHPCFRGNDLARKIGYLLLDAAQKRKEWKYLLNTVSPFNYPSIRSTLSMKMQIIALTEKYGNKVRYIACRKAAEAERIVSESQVWVDTKDLIQQKELLAKGFKGYEIRKINNKVQVAYGLFVPNKEGEAFE